MVEVTDSDKEASADFAHAIGLDAQEFCANADIIVQAFATHRIEAAKAERDRIVAWLRDMQVGRSSDNYPAYFARLIEESQP